MKLKSSLKTYGIRVKGGIEDIPLHNLHYQYLKSSRHEKFWNGYEMMHIKTSPHVELLLKIMEIGFDWKVLLDTPYAKQRRERRTVHGSARWTDGFIKKHIKHRWDTYLSLKKSGYKTSLHTSKNGFSQPVMILRKPFWETRYGEKLDGIAGPEIWDGGGRCAAAFALGWKTIPGVWVEDVKPGSKSCKKIEVKFKDWIT